MERAIRRFPVRNADGDTFTVVEYRDFFQSVNYNQDGHLSLGLKRLATTTGQPISAVGPGTYKIVPTGVIVWPEHQR